MRLSMESLKTNTAKLMEVDIEVPDTYLGQSTRECIQRGLYFGHLGALREIIGGYNKELFGGEKATVVGTGGFSQLFREEKVFDVILPDLVLQGIRLAFENSKLTNARQQVVG
jgi:type III pantothenate kinase